MLGLTALPSTGLLAAKALSPLGKRKLFNEAQD